jgi:hypothetical protein
MLINKILNGLQALLVFNITLTEVGTPLIKAFSNPRKCIFRFPSR